MIHKKKENENDVGMGTASLARNENSEKGEAG
jgi:hypothetical protein